MQDNLPNLRSYSYKLPELQNWTT